MKRRLTAIFSCDAVAFSAHMSRDEIGTLGVLKGHRDFTASLVVQHGGRVVDSVGDNLLAEIPSVVDAVLCAIECQQGIARRNLNLPKVDQLEFRIGIHLGDVIVDLDRIAGDDVNIAARIEGQAMAGGLAISAAAYDQVFGKLNLKIIDVEEHELKNLARPIRIYRVEPAENAGQGSGPLQIPTVPGFAGRPAIAVLPFANLAGTPDDDYFADGIAEDLTIRLAEWRVLPVIAKSSSFAFKGKRVPIKQMSRELAARYLVDGSVRRGSSRLRVNAELIDATSGHHLWAGQYDREVGDIFCVQDEITEAIVSAMLPDLFESERRRARRREPTRLDAWDYIMRASGAMAENTREGVACARDLLRIATGLDIRAAEPWAHIAHTHWLDLAFQWTDSPAASISGILEAAQRAMSLGPSESRSHLASALAHAVSGEADQAIAACEAAIRVNPSDSLAYTYCAGIAAMANLPAKSVASAEKALRLSPRDEYRFQQFTVGGFGHFAAERYDEAREWSLMALNNKPDFVAALRLLAASSAYLSDWAQARTALQKAVAALPEYSVAGFKATHPYADPEIVKRFMEGLRMAGWSG